LGLSATSVAGGVAMGSVGAVYNDMALGVGNMVAFGEWYEPSLKRTGTTALLGGLTGGAVVGGSNLIRGANFWTGIKATSSVSHMVQKGVVNQQGELISNSGKVYVNGGAKGGESIWTSTKKLKSVENAFAHFKKHGAEFSEFSNAKQYVEGAKNFLHNSPTGTLMKTRANGDILKYHPGTNTFGVMDASGVPRTMFKPGDGMQYWLKQ